MSFEPFEKTEGFPPVECEHCRQSTECQFRHRVTGLQYRACSPDCAAAMHQAEVPSPRAALRIAKSHYVMVSLTPEEAQALNLSEDAQQMASFARLFPKPPAILTRFYLSERAAYERTLHQLACSLLEGGESFIQEAS